MSTEREQEPGGERQGEGKRKAGRPRKLDPAAIVAVARRILEEEGVAALSMRRVAKEVGSTPMALYHHVRDKDELLMRVLSGTAATMPRPELPEDPRERLLAVSVHMHQGLRKMPWVVEILSLGDLSDPGALWMVEEIIDSAMACGLDERRAVLAYRTIWHYVFGELVFQAALERRARQPGRRRHFPEMLEEIDDSRLPRLSAVAGRWSAITEDYDVAEELRAVIDGLLAAAGRGEQRGS
ncbi:TetR/AcrR family transcriptional regulator [Streptomyces sp. MST-110588]|uniref:TetR/AcrR family transcriptional regulator n=1 Tax=Streptomyces sp. MST-110588 TaxID=2833628 RepID=UPI001F5C3B3D|nr:TetR/AcrR family transcriptional regulator [Streptomyces sp. MST-110588]UNO41386.1 TetR/AcrR family transcriptional regulator [Streptomyces sp. MST-110588]